MKKLVTLTSVSLALCLNAFSATYTFSNGSGATASGILNSDGRAFRAGTTAGDSFTGATGGLSAGPGVVAVGVFSSDALSGLSTVSSILSLFTNFGNVTNTFAAAAATGNRGIFSLSSPSVTVTGNASFATKNMYLIAGNGSTLAASTAFLIVKSNTLFNAADDLSPTATSVTFRPDTSTLLFGTSVADVKTASTDNSVTPGWQMANVIPEPSSALLGVVGALGFLRRRRN